jgi:F-type H+-transporting ATPase subunit b
VNINLTLIIQMLVFVILVGFTMRYAWPMLMGAMEERTRRIALGIAAGEKGRQELAQAEQKAEVVLREARERAHQIVEQAQRRANDMVEQARTVASAEGQRVLNAAHQQIELEAGRVRESLRRDLGELVVETASKLLEREIDARAHADLIEKFARQI